MNRIHVVKSFELFHDDLIKIMVWAVTVHEEVRGMAWNDFGSGHRVRETWAETPTIQNEEKSQKSVIYRSRFFSIFSRFTKVGLGQGIHVNRADDFACPLIFLTGLHPQETTDLIR